VVDVTGALVVEGGARVGDLTVDLALEVPAGRTVALVGPNGAGKTTLVRLVAGLLALEAGSIRLGDRVLADAGTGRHLPPEDRAVGVVFQDVALFDHLDARDNVAFGLQAQGQRRRAARDDAARWLDRLGVGHRAQARPAQLSGGEAQRVALARALAPGPEALLLDEPLASLDAEVRTTVRHELRRHLREHAGPCLLVTHDLVDAAVLADEVVVLEAGLVTATGTVDELVARPRTPWAAQLAGTNLLVGTAVGATLHLEAGGELIAAEAPGDGPVLVAVPPAGIALHIRRPSGSPRNRWPGAVEGLEPIGARVRVRLAGPVPVVAELTADAVQELGLEMGTPVWAAVKATEVRAYPR
jgi:molybdate transport system ATP-binding protein